MNNWSITIACSAGLPDKFGAACSAQTMMDHHGNSRGGIWRPLSPVAQDSHGKNQQHRTFPHPFPRATGSKPTVCIVFGQSHVIPSTSPSPLLQERSQDAPRTVGPESAIRSRWAAGVHRGLIPCNWASPSAIHPLALTIPMGMFVRDGIRPRASAINHHKLIVPCSENA